MSKKKTYVLTVSKNFPKNHVRAGESTNFVENLSQLAVGLSEKIHTIRGNYDFWKKRIEEVNRGNAILSIRYWSDKPYRSKQVEICTLDNVGIEKVEKPFTEYLVPINGVMIDKSKVAKNDGLSNDDFNEWFRYQESNDEPMALLHFTRFRYT